MRLRQLKLDFSSEHDRLLLRILTDEEAELRFWLTRRYVRLLWPALLQTATRIGAAGQQADPEAKKALLEFEHERAVQQADFSKPYDESAKNLPLGAAPILAARFQCAQDGKGNAIVSVLPADGQGINLTMDPVLLHSFMKLLQGAIARSEWDFELKLPAAAMPSGAADGQRILN
jgi:hypothetical protein